MTGAEVGVLVVDDQAPFRRAVRAVLDRTEGFELLGEADNGAEAVALAVDLHPAVVLMDINMPGMDGIEATRRIMAADPAVVVILCSTLAASDLPADMATSGARAYLSKESLDASAITRIWDSFKAERSR